MRRKNWFFVCVTFFIIIAAFYLLKNFVFDASREFLINEEEIKETDFLKDKIAVIYFSTTADQDMFDDGKGFATFIDKKGETRTYKMGGLELGGMANHNGQLLLEDKNKLIFLGEHYKEFKLKEYQHTGERVGYLPKSAIFYTIFNSGFDDNGGYKSDIYWGDHEAIQNGVIPNYILSSGQDEDFIYIITNEVSDFEAAKLSRVSLKNGLNIEVLTEWRQSENNSLMSNIVTDESYYYYVEEVSALTTNHYSESNIVRIDKKTFKRDSFFIEKIETPSDFTAKSPFDSGKSIYLFNNKLYYVNGLGHVFSYDTKEAKVSNSFHLNFEKENPNITYDEQVAFKDDLIYFFSFDPKTEIYTLDQYNLNSGKLEATQELSGIKEIMNSLGKKYAASYDFLILDK